MQGQRIGYVAVPPAMPERTDFVETLEKLCRVMGFCTEEQYQEFFHSVPEFERMLVRSGIILLKYWFSISDEEQQFRFLMRIHDPLKQWKLSPMDVESRARWEQYTKAISPRRRGGSLTPTTRRRRA